MIMHPAQSMFLGAFPMGCATLINAALVRLRGRAGMTRANQRILDCEPGMGMGGQGLPLRSVGLLVARLPSVLQHRVWHALRDVCVPTTCFTVLASEYYSQDGPSRPFALQDDCRLAPAIRHDHRRKLYGR